MDIYCASLREYGCIKIRLTDLKLKCMTHFFSFSSAKQLKLENETSLRIQITDVTSIVVIFGSFYEDDHHGLPENMNLSYNKTNLLKHSYNKTLSTEFLLRWV